MALVNRERDAEEAHTTINLLKRIFSKSYNFAYHMKLKFQKKIVFFVLYSSVVLCIGQHLISFIYFYNEG